MYFCTLSSGSVLVLHIVRQAKELKLQHKADVAVDCRYNFFVLSIFVSFQGTHALTLEQLAGLFYILLGGLMIAVLITLLRIVKRTIVEEHINLSKFTSVSVLLHVTSPVAGMAK